MPNTSPRARAFWVVEPGRGEIRVENLREPEPGDVLVRTLFSGVSRGTESLVFNGRVPRSEFQRMRAPFQAGDFPTPVKYGYMNVGRVEQGSTDLAGKLVFCLFPHQTHYVVPSSALHRVPEDVPARRALLAANLETAVNIAWDAAPKLGDRVAVVGGGAVGCLVAWLLAQLPGCHVDLIDIDANRERVAAALGVTFASPARATANADLVIHASATAEGLSTALRLAAFEATVVEASWFGDRRPEVPLGEAFHSRRLTLRSSQVGSIGPAQRSRWTTQRRMDLVMRLLASPSLDVLISGESRFDELPDVMPRLASEPGALCHCIVYEE